MRLEQTQSLQLTAVEAAEKLFMHYSDAKTDTPIYRIYIDGKEVSDDALVDIRVSEKIKDTEA